MHLQGGHVFHVPREAIWACLFDPPRLARVIPGCERFAPVGPDTYALDLRISLPLLKGLYRGTIRVTDAVAPDHLTLHVDGVGPAGSVRGAGHFQLAALPPRSEEAPHDRPDECAGGPSGDPATWCSLTYDGDVQLSGMLRLFGAQAVSPAARAVIDRFFSRLEADVLAGWSP
jgi:carbon monoxide dehydrogenase subunit G